MTDNEIKKALEWLERLKRDTDVSEWAESLKIILNEYNRQKAEIERLKNENEILSKNADTAFQDGLNEAQDLFTEQVKDEIKFEVIKEVEKRLKEKLQWDVEFDNKLVFESDIDNFVKEMTE